MTRTIAIGGVRTAVLDAGGGAPIVALHGIPTSSALFTPLLPYLADYRVIAPDLLGQGGTEAPAHGKLDFAAYRRHLEIFLDQVAPPTFHLLVHDFGAVLGLAWATSHAARVKSIVVLSTTIHASARIAALYAANLMLGRRMLRHALPGTLMRTDALPPRLLDEWAAPWTRRRLLRGHDHFGSRHLRELRRRLPQLNRPVLLIWGSEDAVFPVARASALQRLLPDAALETIPQCGHWSPVDAPDDVAAHLRTFFSRSTSRNC